LGGLRRGNTENLAQVMEALRHAESAAIDFNASVAVATGGRHLGRTNALDLVFNLVAEDRACTYVLAYKPEAEEPGKEHRIAVEVDRKRARVRSRESFVDWRPGEQAERRMRMAMAAPGSFNAFDLGLAAFPLGEAGGKTKVLVTVTIPAQALASSAEGLAPAGTIASVRLQGRVATEDASVCAFGEPFELPSGLYDEGARSIHFEAACDLRPGRYELVAAVEEEMGGELAALRREIFVPDLSSLYVGDAQLWVAAQDDLVHRKEAESILGPSKGLERGTAAPRAERRLAPGEAAGLFTLVCPGPSPEKILPVTLTRMLLAGEKPVATFPPLRLDAPPDPATGCWGVTSPLPRGVLGEGIYTFDYQISSLALPEPVSGRADFAVGEPTDP